MTKDTDPREPQPIGMEQWPAQAVEAPQIPSSPADPNADLVEMLGAMRPDLEKISNERVLGLLVGWTMRITPSEFLRILAWANARRDAAVVEKNLLTEAAHEFHRMARRYCDGRMSYAPSSFNALVRKLRKADVKLSDPLFARDGMGRDYDHLTDDEAAAAQEDMPRGHAALETEWMQRTADLHAQIARLREVLGRLIRSAQEVSEGKSSTFKARNGRVMSIETDDGERAAILHCDLFSDLDTAVSVARTALEPRPPEPSL